MDKLIPDAVPRPSPHWIVEIGFTAGLILLVAFAATDADFMFVAVMLGVTVGAVFTLYLLFPNSRFFVFAFANFIAIYSCIFIFFVETNFNDVQRWVAFLGFGGPIVGFLIGAWIWRGEIRRIVAEDRILEDAKHGRLVRWLLPVALIGLGSFYFSDFEPSRVQQEIAFGVSMGLLGLTALLLGRDVASFLIDTGRLLDRFFHRATSFFVPAFAFFNVYALLVIVFACIYRIADRLSPVPNFTFHDEQRTISFSEALYYSVVTMSTVGYGDVTAATGLIRVITAFQVICGVILLLFGFNEFQSYLRRRRERGEEADPNEETRAD